MNTALILSGGVGSRMRSEMPKQYIKVSDKPIICYCLDIFDSMDLIDKINYRMQMKNGIVFSIITFIIIKNLSVMRQAATAGRPRYITDLKNAPDLCAARILS